jgi:hypothetical protein
LLNFRENADDNHLERVLGHLAVLLLAPDLEDLE